MVFIDNPISEIYYLEKDGLTMKLQQIKFSKDLKEPFNTLYEFKSNNVHVFNHHNGKFYIMDES